MDRTVPAAAALLLAFIAKTETSRDFPAAYDVVYGHNQARLPKSLTRMTVSEVIAAGSGWTRDFGSSAAGAYQFMNRTLKDLKTELGLGAAQVLDGNLQDRLGLHLLYRRGYREFMAGQIDINEFAKRLAMEWASFPVLAATKGNTRVLKRGQSYYAGDGLNKALVAPERVEQILRQVKATSDAPTMPPDYEPPPELPEPATTKSAGKGSAFGVLIITITIVLVAIAGGIFLLTR